MYLGPTWILYKLVGNFAMTGLMKTASLGLLEVMVVCANARSNDMIIKLKT